MSPSEANSDGAMIALVPTNDDLDRLALAGGEPRDQLHLTLWYLGDAADFYEEPRGVEKMIEAVRNALSGEFEGWENPPTIFGNAFGAAHWNPDGEHPAWVLNVGDAHGDDRLARVRDVVATAWAGVNWQPPPQYTPWQPHVCVAYDASPELGSELERRLGPIAFDRVRVAIGNEVTDIELAQPATVAAGIGGDHVPWHKVHNHAECPADRPWAVVKDGTSEVEGCHASESDADQQLAALYASENGDASAVGNVVASTSGSCVTCGGHDDRELGEAVPEVPSAEGDVVALARKKSNDDGDCGPGYHRMPDGSCLSDAELQIASRWEGVLCVEGTATGDGREFARNALTWVDGALLRWQKEGSHGGDHDVTVSVGRIDAVERNGSVIRGRGVLNLLEPDGWTIYNRLKNGFAGGISIDADDIADADVEYVWPDDVDDELELEGGDTIKFLFARPEKVIYHGGRVRAATLVDIPAFVEARIALVGDVATAGDDAVEDAIAAAVATHVTEVSDAPWDSRAAQRAWLTTARFDVDPREVFAYVDGDTLAYLHHELVDGGAGPANLTACSAAIARLNSDDDTLSVVDRLAVYEHLASHLRDAGQQPPPPLFELDGESLVAAAVVALDDWRPPRSWFDDPKLSVPTGITVTDQGRVYGHVAPWGECHIGFADECVSPPYEDTHPYFLTGELVCSDGSRVAVGQITVGTGHAPLNYQASRAAEHYDNTGAAVVDVAIGNDAHGIWCAGAVRPTAEAARVHQLRASGRVSGDWRRIGGQLRLVGVLAVNVPGFPIPQLRARVASGQPQALVAAGTHLVLGRVTPPTTEADLDQLAMRRVMNILARRVRGAETSGRK